MPFVRKSSNKRKPSDGQVARRPRKRLNLKEHRIRQYWNFPMAEMADDEHKTQAVDVPASDFLSIVELACSAERGMRFRFNSDQREVLLSYRRRDHFMRAFKREAGIEIRNVHCETPPSPHEPSFLAGVEQGVYVLLTIVFRCAVRTQRRPLVMPLTSGARCQPRYFVYDAAARKFEKIDVTVPVKEDPIDALRANFVDWEQKLHKIKELTEMMMKLDTYGSFIPHVTHEVADEDVWLVHAYRVSLTN